MLRDKRVLYSALVGPVFLVVLFLFLFGFLIDTLEKPKSQILHVVNVEPAPELVRKLEEDKRFRVVRVASLKKGEELVRTGDARVVLGFPADFDESLKANKPTDIAIVYDPDQPASEVALSLFERLAAEAGKLKVSQLLSEKGLDAGLADPIKLDKRKVKRQAGSLGGLLAGLLPYLIVIWAFYGGFSIASDLVAGEKERSTLETLLISPVERSRIAMGKFWALTALCAASSLASVVAVAIAGNLPLPFVKQLFPAGVRVSVESAATMLAVIVPLSAMFAGLLLALSAFARNTRECQGYLSLVSFLVLMPAVFSQFIGYTSFAKAAWVSWVPILNSATVLRGAMLGNFETVPILTTIGTNLALALIAMNVVTALFGREQVLWRI